MSRLSIFVHHPLNSHYKDDNDMQCRFSILQYLLLQNTFFWYPVYTRLFPSNFHAVPAVPFKMAFPGPLPGFWSEGRMPTQWWPTKAVSASQSCHCEFLRDYDPMEYSTNLVSLCIWIYVKYEVLCTVYYGPYVYAKIYILFELGWNHPKSMNILSFL